MVIILRISKRGPQIAFGGTSCQAFATKGSSVCTVLLDTKTTSFCRTYWGDKRFAHKPNLVAALHLRVATRLLQVGVGGGR